MALTPGGTPYVESSDLVANYPAASLALANKVDTKIDYELPTDVESGTTYTFTLANARQLVTATNAGAKTFTIPPQSSVTWLAHSVLRVVNYGAGALTIAGGAGVTVTNATTTLAQYQSAALIRTAENAWTLVPFGGGAESLVTANVTATTGSPSIVTSGGFTTYLWNGSGSITLNKSGVADITVVGGGGGGGAGTANSPGSGGGGGGVQFTPGLFFTSGTFVISIGAGGSGGAGNTGANGANGNTSYIGGHSAVLGGGFGGGGAGNGGSLATGGGRNGVGLEGWGFGAGNANRSGGGGAGFATATIDGGNGKTVSILTSGSTTYGGGGGGGVNNTGTKGVGGTGGGGAGGQNAAGGGGGSAGTANTGGGGGGAGSDAGSGFAGYSGGSGLVIIKVRA